MKTLPHKLRKNSFNCALLLRGHRSCIYAQEWFPNNEAFGVWAWNFKLYEKALEKFNELEKED